MIRRSFAFRLAAAFVGVGIASAAVAALLVNAEFGRRFAGYLDDRQLAQERQVADALEEAYRATGDWTTADLSPAGALIAMEGGTLEIRDSAGDVLWVGDESTIGLDPEMHRTMMGAGPLGPERSFSIEVGGVVVGHAAMRLPTGGLLPHDVSFRDSVNRLLVVGGIAAAAVALVLGLVLARRAIAPARALTSVARAFADGDRTTRIASDRNDEFGEMADAFDTMADTVDEEDRIRRTFASDVAHELRTPLAILRTGLESIQDGVVAADDASIASLHEEVLRLSRLVEDLETLAQADASRFSLRRERIDLGAEVQQAVASLADRFTAAGIELRAAIGYVEVEGDAVRLRQIASNLLSNALKFTPAGTRVTVSVIGQGSEAILEVADDGPGIPQNEVGRVFDRFYRGQHVRAGGSGIGLAIVRDLVQAHGGQVSVESPEGGGCTFSVALPRASGSTGPFTAPSHGAAMVGGEEEPSDEPEDPLDRRTSARGIGDRTHRGIRGGS